MYYDHENDVEWDPEPDDHACSACSFEHALPPPTRWQRWRSNLLLCIAFPFYAAGIILTVLVFTFLLGASFPAGIALMLFLMWAVHQWFVGS